MSRTKATHVVSKKRSLRTIKRECTFSTEESSDAGPPIIAKGRRKQKLVLENEKSKKIMSKMYEGETSSRSTKSPLPDLIIEWEKPKPRFDDEPEEFYEKLAIKMRKLYRHVFVNDGNVSSFDEFSPSDASLHFDSDD